jgi:FkbM family methyltransferase
MLPFRARFAAQRFLSPRYYRRLRQVMAHPLRFYAVLALKLLPGLSKGPVDLRLRDGKTLRVREFWTLFLFDEIFVENCYEPPEVMRGAPYGTVIDIGANIGLFTLRSKQLWPDARVVALEPHPENFQRFLEHVEINRLWDVEPLQAGIAEKCGCFELFISPRNIAGHSMYKKAANAVSISIQSLTLSDVLARIPAGNGRTLLKIDCEGCEGPLLSTMTREIADRIGCIVFEPERSLYDLDAILARLTGFGFAISQAANLIVAAKS